MAADQPDRKIDPELGRRLHRALTAESTDLFNVIQDPSMEVLRATLKNRHLNEDHLLALLKRRDLTEDLLKTIYQSNHTAKSHKLKIALVKNPNAPSAIVLATLPHLHLFELVNLCYIPGVTPDQKYAAERAIIKRLPTTELGNKLTLARRATAAVAAELLKTGETPLVDICLSNPHLREVAILQFLNSATAKAETISMVARHPKWQTRPNLRNAILKNSRTPQIWFTVFLPKLRSHDVRNLIASRRLNPAQKKLVQDELRKRGG